MIKRINEENTYMPFVDNTDADKWLDKWVNNTKLVSDDVHSLKSHLSNINAKYKKELYSAAYDLYFETGKLIPEKIDPKIEKSFGEYWEGVPDKYDKFVSWKSLYDKIFEYRDELNGMYESMLSFEENSNAVQDLLIYMRG